MWAILLQRFILPFFSLLSQSKRNWSTDFRQVEKREHPYDPTTDNACCSIMWTTSSAKGAFIPSFYNRIRDITRIYTPTVNYRTKRMSYNKLARCSYYCFLHRENVLIAFTSFRDSAFSLQAPSSSSSSSVFLFTFLATCQHRHYYLLQSTKGTKRNQFTAFCDTYEPAKPTSPLFLVIVNISQELEKPSSCTSVRFGVYGQLDPALSCISAHLSGITWFSITFKTSLSPLYQFRTFS